MNINGIWLLFIVFYNFSCLEFEFYQSGSAAAGDLQPGRADKVVKKHCDVPWRVGFERGPFLGGHWAFSALTDRLPPRVQPPVHSLLPRYFLELRFGAGTAGE